MPAFRQAGGYRGGDHCTGGDAGMPYVAMPIVISVPAVKRPRENDQRGTCPTSCMMKKTAIRAATTVMPGPPERSERVEPRRNGRRSPLLRRQKETAVEGRSGCRGERTGVGKPPISPPSTGPAISGKTGAHEAEVPRALIISVISDVLSCPGCRPVAR